MSVETIKQMGMDITPEGHLLMLGHYDYETYTQN